jgi:hypothetical protein
MLLAGFPHWEIEFNEDGQILNQSEVESMIVESKGVTDLLIFSHGWNNDRPTARKLYKRFFQKARDVVTERGTAAGVKIGTAGVIWPSTLWPDDEPEIESGGVASAGHASPPDVRAALKSTFKSGDQQAAIEQLIKLLDERPRDPAALKRCQTLLGKLAPKPSDDEDDGERNVLTQPPERIFNAMAEIAPEQPRSALAKSGEGWSRLWTGAKEGMRLTTYWHMKKRAGVVGENGLAKVIQRLHEDKDARVVRVHLIGHSFGARLVSFSLKGLPAAWVRKKSPVKSCTLIQGAFSHYAYASQLPHDSLKGGALKGIADRVDGPLIVTFSEHDKAVCECYTQASLLSLDSSSKLKDILIRFGAMGSGGAKAVEATETAFKQVGAPYPFQKGKFLNLNGNALIRLGDGPFGAHFDIYYPEIAWALLSGARVVA